VLTTQLLDLRLKQDDVKVDKEVGALLKLGDEFDMFGYVKKLATSDVVALFRLSLESYSSSTLDVTHHALSFLRTLACTTIEVETGEKTSSTFEPLMYNVPFFVLCQRVLNDRQLKTSTQK
jgi:hypothetical protein